MSLSCRLSLTVSATMALVGLSTAAHGQEWVKLTEGATGVIDYYDSASRTRVGNDVKIWVLSDHSRDRTVPYVRAKRLYLVRCNEDTAALAAYLSYSEDGGVLENETVPDAERSYQHVSPSSIGSKIIKAACSEASNPSVPDRASTDPQDVGASATASGSGRVRIPLWNQYKKGMSASEVATLLQSDGATKVSVSVDKRSGLALPSYGQYEVKVLGLTFSPEFSFTKAGTLQQVVLVGPSVCYADEPLKVFEALSALLTQKYGPPSGRSVGMEKLSNGSLRQWHAFVDEGTQVELVSTSRTGYQRNGSYFDCASVYDFRINYLDRADAEAAVAASKNLQREEVSKALDKL